MQISASMVKGLRERTGSGMMECKRALTEAGGDLQRAIEILRKKGAAKAEKKAGRVAAEGVVGFFKSNDNTLAALVEVNSETDFVAKQPEFQAFAHAVARRVAEDVPADTDLLKSLALVPGGDEVEASRTALVAKLGENIHIRRFARLAASGDATISSYLHGTRIGVLVESKGGRDDLGRDIAMHIAASRPVCVSKDQVSKGVIEKEREIYMARAAETGKPTEILEKIVSGQIAKYLSEVTLLGQPFVKNLEQTVEQLLKTENASVQHFVRFEVGEGIEKRVDNFADEVLSQAKGG